ncbi:MAG: hypothetical protein IIZ33_04275, partial [Erysipelotrichaceae bacterium]|nr:hypothetical protein [Erysipelotrichaceae bacterium]
IGYGPSGIFAAWRLSEAGLKPVILERGKRIQEREKDVESFFKGGPFNKEDNVAYGEGGAGTFSDAKLTTRVNDPFVSYILKTFIEHGAEERIAVDAHAHVGTDRIRKVISSMTDELIKRGCEFHFGEAVRDFLIEDGKLKAIITDKDTYYSDFFLLGIGHSARDTFEKLYERGVEIIRKDTAIGFRVEHLQSLIDSVQYKGIISEKLEPSEYFLRCRDEKGVYSFCMCPGGFVVPSNAEEGHIVTNGMSYSGRDNELANSAILIQVRKEEYGEGPLSGFDYLESYERKAYDITSSYKAPAMNISDFMKGELHPLIFPSSYPLGTVLYDLSSFYKEEDVKILRKALSFFDEKIPGFIEKGIMVAPESRSSSPVRIPRKEDGEAESVKNLYPMGEGPGYGGGIMSCALDGIRTADRILKKL